jgi:hypothetical protein
MKRNVKNWMTKAAMALALGARILSFAAPQASAQSRNQRFQNEQLRERQERNLYWNRAVNPHHQQQQRRFAYQQPYWQYGYGQYGYYGQYGTRLQPYYPNRNGVRHDDDHRYYQRNNRR